MRRNRRSQAFAAALVFSLLLAACGGDDDDASADKTDQTEQSGGEELSGSISVDGSSTVGPLTTAAAELFEAEYPDVKVTVGTSGTGGGFEKFCKGEIDLADASRDIKPEEASACDAKSITYKKFQVANDGIALVTSMENDWVDCLTVAQLKKIWDDGSTVKTWKDVDPKFPATKIDLFGPGTDSGTFDFFTKAINGVEDQSRSDYSATENDNQTVEGVSGSPGGLGYFGLSYFEENQDKLKLLGVDGGGGCVTPDTKTVQSGTYKPLSRPLFIFPSQDLLDRPEGIGFVEFYLGNTTEITKQALFVDLNDEQLAAVEEELATLSGATTKTTKKASGTGKKVSGNISVDGSSTVGPLTTAAAELFEADNSGVKVTVGTSGTGGGFEKFCKGEIDLADASRDIKPEEAAACKTGGVEYSFFQVANDGIALVTSMENDWVDCLTVAQLKKIWDDGSTVKTWKDVDPKFPATKIDLFGPGTDSGTFDFFTKAINGVEDQSRSDYSATENDNQTVEGVSGSPGGLGYFGLSYFEENQDKLKLLGVDGGGGCVTPDTKTVQSGTYKPLSRPLFIFASKDLLARPEGIAFVEFYLENTTDITEQALFVDLNTVQLAKSKKDLADLKAAQ